MRVKTLTCAAPPRAKIAARACAMCGAAGSSPTSLSAKYALTVALRSISPSWNSGQPPSDDWMLRRYLAIFVSSAPSASPRKCCSRMYSAGMVASASNSKTQCPSACCTPLSASRAWVTRRSSSASGGAASGSGSGPDPGRSRRGAQPPCTSAGARVARWNRLESLIFRETEALLQNGSLIEGRPASRNPGDCTAAIQIRHNPVTSRAAVRPERTALSIVAG